MKRIFVAVFLLMGGIAAYGQTYMDAIVNQCCDCMNKIPQDVTDREELEMKLGLCIIEASLPYKKQLKKEMGIDLDHMDREAEKLGAAIGVKMLGVCPDAVMRMAANAQDDEEDASVETINGTITKVDKDFFVVFSVKDDAGKVSKYYWMTFIESEDDFATSYAALLGKDVSISYKTQEFFDPKIGEYRKFFVITKIQ
jgi:hypothetical protein